eukprot:TRINITY_DN5416_c0_g1_i1.p1 TRINITY_DN5416_c0_g1~~TRINITY_DN5416_c0_g1_i1.p1  ORF type:complete len:504 (+),score=23.25 TRINITY_DN5416_c0_g1_i1:26-1537(+)
MSSTVQPAEHAETTQLLCTSNDSEEDYHDARQLTKRALYEKGVRAYPQNALCADIASKLSTHRVGCKLCACVWFTIAAILMLRVYDMRSDAPDSWPKQIVPNLLKNSDHWSVLGITKTSLASRHNMITEVTVFPSGFKYESRQLHTDDPIAFFLYVPLKATSAYVALYELSWFGYRRTRIGSAQLDLLGVHPAWCLLRRARSRQGCSYEGAFHGLLVAGDEMFRLAHELNREGVQILPYETTRFQSSYEPHTIKNHEIEHELFYAKSNSVFPNSLHGIWWMDQRGRSVPLKSDPEYRQVCSVAAEEVLVTWGEAAWNPQTRCATGNSQFSGGPLSGMWTWLNAGGGNSAAWASGANWNADYHFCFRDASMTYVDVFMQVPLQKVLSWWPWDTIIQLPVWLQNVGMKKTSFGWDRVTTIGPHWLRFILKALGIVNEQRYAVFGDGCHYPVLQVVNGRGERTEHYPTYLLYVNNDTACEEASFECPLNRGKGTQIVGRLAGPLPS